MVMKALIHFVSGPMAGGRNKIRMLPAPSLRSSWLRRTLVQQFSKHLFLKTVIQQKYNMKKIVFVLAAIISTIICNSQSPVGKWKKLSHVSTYDGQTFDSHKALLTQRPCAAKIVWEVNADKTFRLNAATSGCDEKYQNIQQKLYSKTNWRVTGNKITISTEKDFAVGQTYTISYSGNKMIWVGTDGQGTITYQKL